MLLESMQTLHVMLRVISLRLCIASTLRKLLVEDKDNVSQRAVECKPVMLAVQQHGFESSSGKIGLYEWARLVYVIVFVAMAESQGTCVLARDVN